MLIFEIHNPDHGVETNFMEGKKNNEEKLSTKKHEEIKLEKNLLRFSTTSSGILKPSLSLKEFFT